MIFSNVSPFSFLCKKKNQSFIRTTDGLIIDKAKIIDNTFIQFKVIYKRRMVHINLKHIHVWQLLIFGQFMAKKYRFNLPIAPHGQTPFLNGSLGSFS